MEFMKTDRQRLPEFVKNRRRSREGLHELKARLRKARLRTVCESARCPNIVECFARPTTAFMILGGKCRRGCGFCAVEQGDPGRPDPAEPKAVAEAAAELGLQHVVVTSVTRDDLADGGSGHFALVIRAVKQSLPSARVEVLVPDFQGSAAAVETVIEAGPEVFNHNLETAPRLYPSVRPRADYQRSLAVLRMAAELGGGSVVIKSGLMAGLGESREEVLATFSDLVRAGCGVATVGQYLQPRRDLLPVSRYWEPAEFDELAEAGARLGLRVFAGPLVRSSYLADRIYYNIQTGARGPSS